MIMENLEVPLKIDDKYADLVVGELVTLKPQVDDKNYKRVYKIISRRKDKISVEIISENLIDGNNYQQTEHESTIGQVFEEVKAEYFQPYL